MDNQEPPKRNLSLIIALSIPVLMIVFIAAAIYLPRWFVTVEPAAFDFVYTMGQDSYGQYRVQGDRLVREDRPIPNGNRIPEPDMQFFLHDVETNLSREISFAEASGLMLDGSSIAPDGYRLENGRRGGWFPFNYRYDYRKRYLIKDHFSQEMNLELNRSGSYYYGSFRFRGWVTGS